MASCVLVLLLCTHLRCFAQDDERHYDIDGVKVHAGINPADLLMERAYAQRDTNSLFRCSSFQYATYHKLLVVPTYLSDSLKDWEGKPLFISESVSEIYFKKPDRKYEKLVASKTSGVDNPIFNLAFSLLQFQNLYEGDFLPILEEDYLNPLSKNATRYYDFRLADTMVNASDSLFVITFKPKKGMNFKSLRGVLHLDNTSFAIQHIELKPVDRNIIFSPTLTHDYERQPNGCWFPVRMSADFDFPRLTQGGDTLKARAHSVINTHDLQINPELKKWDFGFADVEECVGTEKQNETLLQTYRTDSLSDSEIKTYQLLDSVGQKMKLDRKINMLPALLQGYLPIGPVDLDLESIVNYTYYEGWRFGLGLYTNTKLMKFARIGGYFAYGLKDKAWKWGVSTLWELERRHSILLKIKYFDDIVESGGLELVSRDETGLLNGEYYRHWIITKFDHSKTLAAKWQMRPSQHLTVSVAGGLRWNETLFKYQFLPHPQVNENGSFKYRYRYLRAGLRFAYREKTFRSGDFTMYERSKFPTLQLQYEFGHILFPSNESQFCHKVNVRLHHLQRYKILGYSEIAIDAGWLNCQVPYSLLYVMPAGYEKLGFYGKEQFASMRPNEFVADRYVALFFRHNFGKMWQGSFSPRIVLCQNIAFGWLRNPENHASVQVSSLERGYYETGIMIDEILSARNLLAMGVGVFYRYGPNSYENVKDNFAFKVSLTVPMGE